MPTVIRDARCLLHPQLLVCGIPLGLGVEVLSEEVDALLEVGRPGLGEDPICPSLELLHLGQVAIGHHLRAAL